MISTSVPGRKPWLLAIVFSVCVMPAARAGAAITLLGSAKTASGPNLVPGANTTLSMPAGIPAGAICVAHLATSGDNIITAPSGWNAIRSDINGHQATQALYWHLTVSSEPSSYTWSTGGEIFFEGVIACYAGVDPNNPLDPGAPNGSGATGNGTSLSAPSITTQNSGDMIVGAFMVAESAWGQGVTINVPAPLTQEWSFTDADASFLAAAAGDWPQTSAGSTASLPMITNNGQSTDGLIAQTIALQPSAGSSPPPPPPPPGGPITFLAAATSASGSTSTGNITLGMPSPAAVPAGSVCLAHLATTGPNTFTIPAGWALIRTDQLNFQGTQAIYWHLTGGSEAASYTWTTGGGVFFEGGIACYAGVNVSNPVDPGAPDGSGAVANGTTANAPSITTQSSGDLIIGFAMAAESSFGQGVTIQLPATMTSLWSLTDSSANFLAASAADFSQGNPGSTGGLTITTGNGQASDGLIVEQVALQPSSNSVPPPPPPGIGFVSSVQTAGGSTRTSSVRLAMPQSLPADDVCVAHVALSAKTSLAVPSGWTTIVQNTLAVRAYQGLFYHVTNASEPANYTWTAASLTYYEGAIGCYSGVNTTAPVDPGSPAGASATAVGVGKVTVPSITTRSNGDLILAAFMIVEGISGEHATLNLPNTLTRRWNFTDYDTTFLAAAAGDMTQAAAGATGGITATESGGLKLLDGLIGQVVALQPKQ